MLRRRRREVYGLLVKERVLEHRKLPILSQEAFPAQSLDSYLKDVKGEYTVDLVGDCNIVIRVFEDLFGEITNCLLNFLDDESLTVLATHLESIELFIQSIFLINGLVQFMTNLSVKNIGIMMCIQRSRVRFSNRNPFPERLSHIALLSVRLKITY